MIKVRNKVTLHNAEQYFGFNKELPAGVCFCHKQHSRLAHIHGKYGFQLIENGDWIFYEDCDRNYFVITKEEFDDMYEVVKVIE